MHGIISFIIMKFSSDVLVMPDQVPVFHFDQTARFMLVVSLLFGFSGTCAILFKYASMWRVGLSSHFIHVAPCLRALQSM